MSKTVIIPTAGQGTRMGSTCRNLNKSLLPYLNKPLISHIIERFPLDHRFVIPLGHLSQQVRWMVELCHGDRDLCFVEVDNHQGPGSGTAQTLRECQHLIDGPFYYVSCDTYWDPEERLACDDADVCWVSSVSPEDSQRYTMFRTDHKGRATEMDFKIRKDGGWVAFTGLMHINNSEQFFHALNETGAEEFVHCLRLPIETRRLGSWKDMGTLESYQQHTGAHRAYDFTKEDEITWSVGGKIVKWNKDRNNTLGRYDRARSGNPRALPRNIEHGEMLAYDRVSGTTGYQDPNPETLVDRLLSWLEKEVWITVPEVGMEGSCRDFYVNKSLARIEKFASKNKDVLTAKTINGVAVSGWRKYLENMDWNLLISERRSAWIHGDMQPDNVIIADDGSIRAIDWRSSFGLENSAGDVYYDLAKLVGGCLIDYSRIKENDFSVENLGNGDWRIQAPGLGDALAEEKILGFAEEKGLSTRKILLLVPLIYWNMAPLHSSPFDDLLWCIGLMRFRGYHGF